MQNNHPSDYLSLSDKLLAYESSIRSGEFSFIAGIDEAGRGCLAGPVVAAAVVFTDFSRIPAGVNDSKALTHEKRMDLRQKLLSEPSVKWAVGIVSAEEIDQSDILRATWKAMRLAAEQLIPPAQFILVDGNPVKGLPLPSQNIVKGDANSASIAAASILAKTTRDAMMEEYEQTYPGYGFAEHKGYGTAQHLEALRTLGVTPIHRTTFEPVRLILHPPEYTQQDLFF
ncbi:MAG: ribonuclease HII [Lentisphaeria bacterium]|nr:ribonuclease HII [Lentisphaeria bacterium]